MPGSPGTEPKMCTFPPSCGNCIGSTTSQFSIQVSFSFPLLSPNRRLSCIVQQHFETSVKDSKDLLAPGSSCIASDFILSWTQDHSAPRSIHFHLLTATDQGCDTQIPHGDIDKHRDMEGLNFLTWISQTSGGRRPEARVPIFHFILSI
jgi:hypothetical protein